ncbi:hypothetical protein DM01DRAFT_1277540, partial [Hesseltinella vesiculosa]
MNRNVMDVVQLWTEYANGINGGPSIKSLERIHGSSWRSTKAVSRYFARRRPLFTAVIRRAQDDGVSEEAAARSMEIERLDKNMTLVQYC